MKYIDGILTTSITSPSASLLISGSVTVVGTTQFLGDTVFDRGLPYTSTGSNQFNGDQGITGSLSVTSNIQANKFVFTDGIINEGTTGQKMFAVGGNYMYLYTGTNGLYINNQANTANNVVISDAGTLQTKGTITAGWPGNDQSIYFGGTNAGLYWASSGASIAYSVGALNFSSVGSTNNMVLQMNGGALFNSGITGSLQGTASYAVNAPNYVLNSITSSMLSGYARTTSNQFNGNQTITGSLTITQNLTVLGSSSIAYVTSSQLNISTNLITVNTATPSIRFGGLAVYDSGSTSKTGSMLWDSQNDVWIYSNPSGASYDGAMILMGPRNATGLGNEVGISSWYAAIGDGSHHMTSSAIYNSGSLIRLENNTQVTGSLNVSAGITGSLLGTASWATNASTASYVNPLNQNITITGSAVITSNLSVGTTSTTSLITISGSVAQPLIHVENANATGYTNMRFSGTSKKFVIGVGNGSETTFGVPNQFFIYDDTTGTMRMTVDTSGNVGIGTTSPQGLLHVQGNITASGNITAQTNLVSANSSGDEGGEILLYKSVTNNSLTGSGITIDSYQNKLRFFEQGGNARGAYLDITTLGNSVGTNLQKSNNYFYDAYLINAQTTAAGVDTTINNISLSTKANEAWSFEFATIGQCSGTAGVRFTVVYSATPVSSSVTYWGNSSQVGNMSSATTILTTPAQSGTIWATATPIDVQAKITACFVNAGSANTVTIKFQPVNAAQTATLRAMTYMTARRIS